MAVAYNLTVDLSAFANATTDIIEQVGPLPPQIDTLPGIMIGISCIMGTIWWITTWFLFLKTNFYDPDMELLNGTAVFPIIWLWENLGSANEGWIAWAYLSFFLGYIIELVELIAYAFYLAGSKEFLIFWESFIGLFASMILLIFGPVLALCHWMLGTELGGLAGDAKRAFA